ncbi:MAG TPA: PASTA domain-containing protein [Gaiellaceae bacterium]
MAGDSLSRFLAAFAACAALDLNLAWLHAFLGHALGEGDLHSGRLGHRHGVATSPTGTVEFSASSIDAFPDPAACTLSGGSCQITYTAYGFAPSTQTITASYGGDSGHATSSGAQDIAVIPYTGPGPRPPILYCRVPNVTDQTLAQATRALRHFGCRPGRIGKAFSKRVKKGRVISQKPGPGKRLPERAKIRLVVSKGKPARRSTS